MTADNTAPNAGAPPKKLKILLVEDNFYNQKLAAAILKTRGHEAILAENGKIALQRCAEQTFDVILMDIQMPEMDGVEATRRIREMEKDTGRRTPIIAVTAYADEENRKKCENAGMDAFIPKPLKKERFLAVLENISEKRPSPAEERAAPDAPDAVVDKAVILDIAGGSRELLGELIALYLQTIPDQLAKIRDAVASRDGRALEFEAHSLKGMSMNMAAGTVAGLALNMEKMGKTDDMTNAAAALPELEAEIERLTRALTDILNRGADA